MESKVIKINLEEGENFSVYEDRLVVEIPQSEEKTSSGIFIPETSKEESLIGEVAGVGDSEELYIKKGHRVVFNRYAGIDIEIKGIKYKIMRQMDVLGLITKEKK